MVPAGIAVGKTKDEGESVSTGGGIAHVTATFATLAPAIAPAPLATVQTCGAGDEMTDTAYEAPFARPTGNVNRPR